MFKKQGTSDFSEVTNNIDWIVHNTCSLLVVGEGYLNFLIFWVLFLDLGLSQEFIASDQWSETREQNLNDLLSYNGPQILIKVGSSITLTFQWPYTNESSELLLPTHCSNFSRYYLYISLHNLRPIIREIFFWKLT